MLDVRCSQGFMGREGVRGAPIFMLTKESGSSRRPAVSGRELDRRLVIGTRLKAWLQGQSGGRAAASQVRFHVSAHKSGSLTYSAWPSAKLTLTAQALGSGWVEGQSRGALPGGLAPCLARVTHPIGRAAGDTLFGGVPRNKSLAGELPLSGHTYAQFASANIGVFVGYWMLACEGKLFSGSSRLGWPGLSQPLKA